MFLNNARICLNMPGAAPKITVQAKTIIACTSKNNYSLELASKDTAICLTGI